MKKRFLKKITITLGTLVSMAAIGAGIYLGMSQGLKVDKNKNNTPTNPINHPILSSTSLDLKAQHYRIMSFNIMNYGGSSSVYNSPKVLNIATSILKSKATLVGLSEINYNQGTDVNRIIKMLNTLDPQGHWDYVVQNINDLVDANHPLKTATLEQIAIVYSQNDYELIDQATYQNLSGFANLVAKNDVIIPNGKTFYPRKPYGALFKNKHLNKYIVSVFAHFDSPGVGTYEKAHNGGAIAGTYENKYVISSNQVGKNYYPIGNQEISEAANIDNLYTYFYTKFQKYNPSFIMGADTNIPASAASIMNSLKLVNNYYPSQDANQNKYLTSLVSSKTFKKTNFGYANSYDHWFFKENDNLNILDATENPTAAYKFDIVNGFKEGYFDKKQTLKLWKQVYAKKQNDPKYANPSEFNLIRIGLSDHAPILIDYTA